MGVLLYNLDGRRVVANDVTVRARTPVPPLINKNSMNSHSRQAPDRNIFPLIGIAPTHVTVYHICIVFPTGHSINAINDYFTGGFTPPDQSSGNHMGVWMVHFVLGSNLKAMMKACANRGTSHP
jgi:hypothetical protein